MIRIIMIDATIKMLGEVAEVRLGYPFRGSVPEVPDGPVAVVQMRDLTPEGVLDWTSVRRTDLEAKKEPEWLRPGDVLFASRGPSNYAGHLAQVPERAVCSPHLYVLTVRNLAAVLPEFIAWQINRVASQRYLRQSAEGSDQLSVRRTILEELPLTIPSVEHQHRLLALDHAARRERMVLETLIKNRERQIEALAAALLTPPNT